MRADFSTRAARTACGKRDGHWEATNTTVRVNGLVIRPADDSRPTLVVDPHNKTVRGRELTMPFRVSLASRPGDPIYAGPIKWDYSDSSGSEDGPRKVLGFDADGIEKLKGLPVTEADLSFLKSGKARLTPTLKLDFWPFNYFGAVTTSTTFTTDNDHGVDFSGLYLKLPKVNVLALELKDVELKWVAGQHLGGRREGRARIRQEVRDRRRLRIKNGGFDYLRGSVGGLNQPVGAGIFLQSIGFGVQRDPLTLTGTIGLSGRPEGGGRPGGLGGRQLRAVLADPFIAEISGNAKVANRFELGSASCATPRRACSSSGRTRTGACGASA